MEVSTDFDRTLTPVYEEQPIIALMNETEKIYSSGKFGFIKQLENSNEECLLLVDETITVKRKYKDNTLTFTTSEDVMEPQGFSMNIPLNDYRSAGVVLTLSVPYDASSWKWTVSCGNDVNTMKEIHSKRSMLSDGQMMISFDIPKDQIDNQKAFIRLEAVSRKGSVSFSLLGFRVYGIPLEPALARAYEFVRMLQTIDAEDYYYPDLGQMENWNPADIDEETTYLRNRLQVDMIREAITTVGTLGLTTSESRD